MKECPYCYTAVGMDDSVCPKCGREIQQWQTGFYTRQRLPKKKSAVVLSIATVAFLLVAFGFAKACHLF
jgi:predicted nucleic acid-binding Zn ribbon protein